jgi:hypothetical protein
MKRATVYYYSFTEQCRLVAEHMRAAFPAGWDVRLARIVPDDPKWHLTLPLQPFWRRFLGTIFPTTRGEIIAFHLDDDPGDAADLVIVGGPTWWSHVSVPMNSFLRSELARARLAGKTIALFAGCRGVYKPNLARMTELVAAVGGRVAASEFFTFTGGLIGSFMSFFSYVMSGLKRDRWLGVKLPPYGFTDVTLAKSSGLVQRLLAAAGEADSGAA